MGPLLEFRLSHGSAMYAKANVCCTVVIKLFGWGRGTAQIQETEPHWFTSEPIVRWRQAPQARPAPKAHGAVASPRPSGCEAWAVDAQQ